MKTSIALTAAVLLAVPACLWASPVADPICEPLMAFVASVKPNQSRELTLHTIWGSNFKGAADAAIFAKKCEHHGYGPAEAACDALMEHVAVEFSAINAQRALSCLAPETQFRGVSLEHGAFSLRYGTEERGSIVAVEYGEDHATGGMALRVAADGY